MKVLNVLFFACLDKRRILKWLRNNSLDCQAPWQIGNENEWFISFRKRMICQSPLPQVDTNDPLSCKIISQHHIWSSNCWRQCPSMVLALHCNQGLGLRHSISLALKDSSSSEIFNNLGMQETKMEICQSQSCTRPLSMAQTAEITTAVSWTSWGWTKT